MIIYPSDYLPARSHTVAIIYQAIDILTFLTHSRIPFNCLHVFFVFTLHIYISCQYYMYTSDSNVFKQIYPPLLSRAENMQMVSICISVTKSCVSNSFSPIVLGSFSIV